MSLQAWGLLFGFVILPALCIGLEKLWPQQRHYRTLRAGLGGDVLWYLAQSLVSRLLAPWVVFAAVLPVFLLAGLPLENYWAGFGPLGALPFAAQLALVFVLGDFLSYWQHRLFHTRRAWPVHAVHHSSRELDWLSSTRFHPLNEVGAQLIFVAPLIAIGLSPLAFVWLAPFTATYAVLLHANVRWHYGPLRHVIASPTFHRWHHSRAAAAQHKNFAGFLPLWDLLFGTYYHPRGAYPEDFGIEDPVPEGFWRQLAYPFRAAGGDPAAASTAEPARPATAAD